MAIGFGLLASGRFFGQFVEFVAKKASCASRSSRLRPFVFLRDFRGSIVEIGSYDQCCDYCQSSLK